MAWNLTRSLDDYEAHAAPRLAADPVRNTLMLTIAAALRRRGPAAFGEHPPRFGWYAGPGGGVEAAFLQTPPHPLVFSAMPDDDDAAAAAIARELSAALAWAEWPVAAVNGPVAAAQSFAEAECARTAGSWRVAEKLRLYRLDELVDPDPMPPGSARLAEPRDAELLQAWQTQFAVEVGLPPGSAALVEEWIKLGTLVLWAADGGPVSMAAASPQVEGTVRVGPVYTPKGLRGRGYGGAATAARTRLALERGAAEVLLFTDLDNPTSNALYQRLGYRPLEDRLMIDFED